MRKWILALLIAWWLILPGPARAQTNASFSKLEVDLWPEYDRPEMLVIYHAFLESAAAQGTNISLHIPAAAGDPAALAERHADNQLYNLSYTRTVSGDQAVVSFSTTAAEIQLEYYDPGLVKNGSGRSYSYTWPGDYPVKQLQVQVQQPYGASSMQITPTMGSGIPGEGGLLYFTADLGSAAIQKKVTVQLSYQKSGDSLSVQSGKVAPAAPVDATTPGRASIITGAWPIVLGIIALGLIGGGGYWFWRSNRAETTQSRRKRKGGSEEQATRPNAADMVFCHQCGKKALPGDLFCRSCGARLRRD